MEIGQCVLTAACSFVKCSSIKALLPPSMPGLFENCRAQCCKDGSCEDVPETGGPPIVPYGPLVPEQPVPETMPLLPSNPEHPAPVTLPLIPPNRKCLYAIWFNICKKQYSY